MRISIFLLCIAFVAANCTKQSSTPNPPPPAQETWTVYSKTNSPLPNMQVNALAISNQEVKWIGTAQGLAKLQAENWQIFTTANAGLPSNFIRALACEQNGTLWVGTDNGLARFAGNQWVVYNSGNSLMTANGVLSLVHDTVNSTTWVATSKELIRINAAGQWTRFDELEDDVILSMATAANGDLWLGTHHPFSFRGRLRKFNGTSFVTYQLDFMGYPSAFPHGMAVDGSGNVYAVVTGTSVKSVLRFASGSWQEVDGPANATGLRKLLVQGNKIWVGGNQLSLFGNAGNIPETLPGGITGVQAMALDRSGRKWLGTVDGGLLVRQ